MPLLALRIAALSTAWPLLMTFGCHQQSAKDKNGGTQSSDPKTIESVDEPIDEEGETALEPVEVSGAYLTAVYPAAGAPAKDGKKAFSVKVLVAATGKGVTDPVDVNALTYNESGTPVTVSPEPFEVAGKTRAVFYMPDGWDPEASQAEVNLSVNESAAFTVAASILADSDSSSGSSGNANAPLPLADVEVHQLFVSNRRYKPGIDFKDVRAANSLCNKEAILEPELAGFWWKAVLAAPGQTIAQRIPLYGAIENLLGEELGAPGTTLSSLSVGDYKLQFANFGTVGLGTNNTVMTGSRKDGSVGETCGGWAKSTGNADAGTPATGTTWLNASTVSCGEAWRLYCISSKKKATD